MKKIILLCLFLLPFILHAQQTLKGIVIDAQGHPLDAVTITLSQQNKNIASAFADSGKFVLIKVNNGSYTLSATLVGYKSIIRTIEVPKDSLKIVMQPDSKQLKEATK